MEAACDRYLAAAGISDATRKAYGADLRAFAAWFGPDSPIDDVDIRVSMNREIGLAVDRDESAGEALLVGFAAVQHDVATDPHPLAKWRVIATLRNMSEFQAAFDCKARDPMVRPEAEQCRLW